MPTTIVLCGTPGTGKSSLIERLKPELGDKFNFLNLSQYAIENGCIESYDESLDTHVMDEEKLLDSLEATLEAKEFNIIECIHADLLSPDLVDWVFVCRTDNTKLYDRLKARNYNENKISNNVQAEIFQLIYDEALENFGSSILTELTNNDEKDLETNLATIMKKVDELVGEAHKIDA